MLFCKGYVSRLALATACAISVLGSGVLASEAEVACNSFSDDGNISNPGSFKAGYLRIFRTGSGLACNADYGDFGEPNNNDANDVISIFNNLDDEHAAQATSGDPYWSKRVGVVVFFPSTTTNVTVNGQALSSDEKLAISTAENFAGVVQLDFEGNTYHFDLQKAANGNEIKGFSLMAGPATLHCTSSAAS
ncbi:MAG: hypothetical protein JJ902_03550 [Roseibium sp.]|nr:hypothetical protein [Roseibium sp.]